MQAVTACATVDSAKTVSISFTNVDMSASQTVTVTLTSAASFVVSSAEVITGSAINSFNDFGAAEQVNIKTLAASNYSLNGKTLSVTLPSKSVAMIRLSPPVGAQSGMMRENYGNAFAIKTGSHRSILISSSTAIKTPVTVSLYGIDGRTLIDRFTTTFDDGKKMYVLGNGRLGRGVYLVRINGENVNVAEKVIVSR